MSNSRHLLHALFLLSFLLCSMHPSSCSVGVSALHCPCQVSFCFIVAQTIPCMRLTVAISLCVIIFTYFHFFSICFFTIAASAYVHNTLQILAFVRLRCFRYMPIYLHFTVLSLLIDLYNGASMTDYATHEKISIAIEQTVCTLYGVGSPNTCALHAQQISSNFSFAFFYYSFSLLPLLLPSCCSISVCMLCVLFSLAAQFYIERSPEWKCVYSLRDSDRVSVMLSVYKSHRNETFVYSIIRCA